MDPNLPIVPPPGREHLRQLGRLSIQKMPIGLFSQCTEQLVLKLTGGRDEIFHQVSYLYAENYKEGKDDSEEVLRTSLKIVGLLVVIIPHLSPQEVYRLPLVNQSFRQVCRAASFQEWVVQVNPAFCSLRNWVPPQRLTSTMDDFSFMDMKLSHIEQVLGRPLEDVLRETVPYIQKNPFVLQDNPFILERSIQEFNVYPALINIETIQPFLMGKESIIKDIWVNQRGILYQSCKKKNQNDCPLILRFPFKKNPYDYIDADYKIATGLDERLFTKEPSFQNFPLSIYTRSGFLQPVLLVYNGLIRLRNFYNWFYERHPHSFLSEATVENLQREYIKYFFSLYISFRIKERDRGDLFQEPFEEEWQSERITTRDRCCSLL